MLIVCWFSLFLWPHLFPVTQAQTSLSAVHLAATASTPTSTPAADTSANALALRQFQLGQQLEEIGEFDDALGFYKAALQSTDPDLQAKAVKAISAINQKKRRRQQSDDPKNSYLELGRSWRDHRKTDEAIAAYEKALDANSREIRKSASDELSGLITRKTVWWQQYLLTPSFALLTSKPIVLIGLMILAALLIRTFLKRTDLLLIPNPSVPDTQWLPILINDYYRQLTQSHSFTSPRSTVPLVLFGQAAELFADLLSGITKVENSSWRQWLVRFFKKPRFQLYLSLPPNNQAGIVTAALSKGRDVRDCFIKEFATNELPSVQKDLAFWVARRIGRGEE